MRCKRSLCPSRRACHSAGVAKRPRWMRRLPLPNRMARLLMAPSRQLWSRSAVTSCRSRSSTFPPAGCDRALKAEPRRWSRTIPALRHPLLMQDAPSALTIVQSATSCCRLQHPVYPVSKPLYGGSTSASGGCARRAREVWFRAAAAEDPRRDTP